MVADEIAVVHLSKVPRLETASDYATSHCYVGPTPPRGDYFSFTPYLWVRRQPTSINLVGKGDWVFAAVNDPLNNGLIKTEGNGNPFHKQTIVIFTADRGVYFTNAWRPWPKRRVIPNP